ncbi:MAG: Mrp/NBP35 family ATP-binding protein [Lachnospiraceae bacterium]|nr:Mrp/NBP35 family ATP-binding protein [Lachnospiraceae bacterium]
MARDCDNTSCTRESCEGCPSKSDPVDFSAPVNGQSRIAHVIGVMSGKGGVGKSSVTAMLAVALRRQGYEVGILDADITGPSIPHLFGVSDIPGATADDMLPAVTETGIKIISVNLLLEDTSSPVIWRGPVLGSVIRQFWTNVIWGELDYLLVDMPPGTGDVPLTVFQALPLDGVILVSSPQSLVNMVVGKAWGMAKMMNIPVLAVIENFSYVECPDCGKKLFVFGEGKTEAWAAAHAVPFALKLPMDPSVSAYGDEGKMERYPGRMMEAVIPFLR